MKAHLLTAVFSAAASFAWASAPPASPVLPFIEDDYSKALAEARATHRPIFVEAWAPW
jgi:hypothetical protein